MRPKLPGPAHSVRLGLRTRAEDSRSFPRDFQGFGVELGLRPPSPGVGQKAQGLPQARSPSGIAPGPRGLAPAGLASAVAAASQPPSQPSTAAPRSSPDFAVATSPACAADAASDTQPPGMRTAAPPPGRRAETTPCRRSTAALQSPHPRCLGGLSRSRRQRAGHLVPATAVDRPDPPPSRSQPPPTTARWLAKPPRRRPGPPPPAMAVARQTATTWLDQWPALKVGMATRTSRLLEDLGGGLPREPDRRNLALRDDLR